MPNLVDLIKKIALNVVEDSKPVAVVFGEVVSASPLKVNIEQKLTLEDAHLILPARIKEGQPLKEGENVILLRQQKGQLFVVLDRM
ncbi:DUF2577 domain-containing protein [Peribacillus loiseleuriae]|uniref:Phage portal protein n=1 Tax=Peribacillus loiseleuriae TaxID=1679170 RepID=A0A0K9GRF7_9BACI|nr:DUF2577 domain-containing protein [Peribacillus loiseleuriae]KMY49240.1 hypothetical protein AC625_06655 [Peribacillus loiseleuriae]